VYYAVDTQQENEMSNCFVRQSAGSLEITLGTRGREFFLQIDFERGAYSSATDVTISRAELVALHAKIGELLVDKA
jgi:hypothetical protein